MAKLNPPLVPKNGTKAKIIVVCRVSDPAPGKQDIRSLTDQRNNAESILRDLLDIPFDVTVVEGSGSGEIISRKEYRHLEELVESGEFDLVITEDLGRILRRLQAHLFAELCVDSNTRLIAINDHVDTAEPGWQDRSIFAAWHHERSNRDTSERIKRTHLSRFQVGGCAQFAIFGIIKPVGSKNDTEWYKDPEAIPIYQEIYRMLWEHGNYSAVADWLNEGNVPTGPMCTLKRWNGGMVRRIISHPILHGKRFRNKHKSKRNSEGRYRAVKAHPHEIKWREVPHLAFFTEEEHVALLAKLQAQHKCYSVRKDRGIPASTRRRTRFPGQLTYCGICGRPYVFGGHGQTDNLMCDGAREYKCWNGVAFSAPLACHKVVAAVFDVLELLPAFDEAFLTLVNEEADRLDTERHEMSKKLDKAIQEKMGEIERLLDLAEAGARTESLVERMNTKEIELAGLRSEKSRLYNRPSRRIEVPSIAELRSLARMEIGKLDSSSWKFQQLMAKIVPKIVVFPLQIIDGGRAYCRATFRMRLGNFLTDPATREALQLPLERVVTVDLFEPPQRTNHLNDIRTMRRDGCTEKEVAKTLGITITAAQRAAAIGREMERLGLDEPYKLLRSPDGVPKLTRHLHKRYKFDPLPGAGEF